MHPLYALIRTAATSMAILALFTIPARAAADEVTHWNLVATTAAEAGATDPLTESRVFAILHLAIHDAINAVDRRFEPFAFRSTPSPTASVDAAVAAAAQAVLAELLPAHAPAFTSALHDTLARVADGASRDLGVVIGRRAARAVLDARADDGAAREVVYAPRDVAGDYRPTPPDLTPALFAHWGMVTPFALTASAQFRPAPPLSPDSQRARDECEEIRRIGGEGSAVRTAEQSEIARYWYENSTQGWNRIARVVL